MNIERNELLTLAAGLIAVVAVATQVPLHTQVRTLRQEVQVLRAELDRRGQATASVAPQGLPSVARAPEPAPPFQTQVPRLAQADLDGLPPEFAEVIGGGLPPDVAGTTGGAKPKATPEPETEPDNIRIISSVEKSGILLPRGKWQVEPSVTYTHSSSNRVGLSGFSIFDVVFVGEILSEEVDRDIVIPALTARYGVTDRFEAEFRLPWQYRRDEELTGPIQARTERINDAFGLSDVQGALYYQLVYEGPKWPHIIANVQVKAPTGDAPLLGQGNWGVKGGLLFVKTSDPAILYASLGYYANLPGEVNNVDTDPGDSFELGLGMAYALNYNLSLNAGFEQLFIGTSQARGADIAGSRLTVSNLKAGVTWALSEKSSLDLSVGAGLTEDSPDVAVSVSLPYSF